MFFTYLVECSDKTYYCGSTNNLVKRIFDHNNSKNGAHYTKIRRPVKLVYSEAFDSFKLARKREVAIKKLSRGEKSELINSLS